jgi:hypothetical protein
MLMAARIFGDQVGSTAPVFLAFLAVHVLAGLVRKGSPRHIRAGRWYYRAITVVFATATVLAALRWRQDYYLFVIGAVAFTAATVGYLHRRRHRPGDTGHIAGMGGSYVAMLTAFYVDKSTEPESTRFPDDAWLRPTCCSVTVSVGKLVGGTPAHNVTLGPSLKVPTGTRVPAAFFSHAS